jgi:predicted  nucleic acid-binding Zn-ribbon protein
MEPCSTVLVLGAAAGVLTAGSSAASTAAQIRGTAKERDELRHACEKIGQELVDTKKKHEDESQKKDAAISVLTIVSVLTFNDLRDVEKRLENKETEYAETKAALDASKTENAKSQAELKDARKKLDNFETLLWVGVPTLIILLALAFYFARVKA